MWKVTFITEHEELGEFITFCNSEKELANLLLNYDRERFGIKSIEVIKYTVQDNSFFLKKEGGE